MADINKRLLTSSDGIPAPQHKVKGESDFEFTEGSGGAQHTKIVDSSGQPISIDDELKSIKRTQAEILNRLDNGIDTRLTGSIIEYENIFERDIRNESEVVFIQVPNNAIGAIIQLSVYAITGDVSESNEGLSLRVRNFATGKSYNSRSQISDMITEYQNRDFACNVIIYPLPTIANNDYNLNPPVVHDSILGDRLRVYANISGTFGTGEGIDCEGNIQWLKR